MNKRNIAATRTFVRPVAGLAWAAFFVSVTVSVLLAVVLDQLGLPQGVIVAVVVLSIMLGAYLLMSLKVANEWEKAILLRAGKFRGLRGPGLFWTVPVLDTIPVWIDHRVMVTPFNAEKTLTKDTVPVDVDAVLFWVVWDAKKAALEVEDYRVPVNNFPLAVQYQDFNVSLTASKTVSMNWVFSFNSLKTMAIFDLCERPIFSLAPGR